VDRLPKIKSGCDTPRLREWRTLLLAYRQRSLVGLALMTAQAFFYTIFFTFALVLTDFFASVQPGRLVILPFRGKLPGRSAGRLFDTLAAAR